jgi:hypothetical protein
MPGAILIIGRVYGSLPGRTTGKIAVPEQTRKRNMTSNRMLQAGAALLLAVMLVAGVHAHHGWSEYDSSKPLTVTGVVKESGYEHPHGHVHLEAPGKTWQVVLAPPSRMERRGLSRADLKPGTRVTVVGYANRGKPEEMRAERITVGGKTVELR